MGRPFIQAFQRGGRFGTSLTSKGAFSNALTLHQRTHAYRLKKQTLFLWS